MMSGLDLTDVRKGFGGAPVLDGVSLSVAPGEIVSLIGPSGSGKSTLLSLLTGALAPESGRMLFDGAPMTGRARPVAYMPQRDALLPWRRALDNAAVGLEVAGVRRREARQQADAFFDTFGLQGTQDRYPRQLSGGMRQRVSLLRTVVQKKPLLLLDEPFGALDAITRDDLQMWLLNIWAVHRWSILLVTHDIREAIRLSDRVHVLSSRPGRLVGEVQVSRDIPRDDRFFADPRIAPLEGRLHDMLRAGSHRD
ncbi:MAG: ABC transporter ATP-binding protein [Microbacterium gubbeenense]|uniref:ABC transporter ATP-binding protein n=1 Tax=Microbacterium gubbeenense TaxID=159896 RepID=UPI003F97C994